MAFKHYIDGLGDGPWSDPKTVSDWMDYGNGLEDARLRKLRAESLAAQEEAGRQRAAWMPEPELGNLYDDDDDDDLSEFTRTAPATPVRYAEPEPERARPNRLVEIAQGIGILVALVLSWPVGLWAFRLLDVVFSAKP